MKLNNANTLFLLLFILFSGGGTAGNAQIPAKGLIAFYPLDGNVKEYSRPELNGTSKAITAATDRFSKQGCAIRFIRANMDMAGYAVLPVDLSPVNNPVITICFWIKVNETFKTMNPLSTGESGSRGFLTEYSNGAQRWSASAGKDGLIGGPPVLKDQWTFVALMYNGPEEQARLIVNNAVYGGRARMRGSKSALTLGSFDGCLDELRIYKRMLSLAELDSIYGQPINVNTGDFPVTDRSSYRQRIAEQRKANVHAGERYIAGYDELLIRDSVNSPNILHVFHEGDTLTVIKEVSNEWFEVKNQEGKSGYLNGHSLEAGCYKTGSNKLIFRFLNWLSRLFMLNRFGNWIFVALSTLVLFLCIRHRVGINTWYQHLGKKDLATGYGSKSEGTTVSRTSSIFDRYFPVESPKWWIIAPGLLFGLMLIVGSLWDQKEMQWYFSEGAGLIPKGFSLPIHWVLWVVTLLIFLLIAVLILESFSLAGPYAGLLRIAMLTVLNLMAVIVAFYISIGIILAVIAFALFLFAIFALLGRRR